MKIKMSKRVLVQLLEGECDGRYCILKEIAGGMGDRFLMQAKCIEKYKWELSNREQRDIGWREASKRWAEEGYAERFSRFYEEGRTFKQIWKDCQ